MMWQLGRHRLLCGDATDPANVVWVTDGARIDMVYTDPPYGREAYGKHSVPCKADFGTTGDGTTWLAKRCYEYCEVMEIPVLVFWGGIYFDFLPANSGWIVWNKEDVEELKGLVDCELAWTNSNKPAKMYNAYNDEIKRPRYKPVDLAEQIFEDYGNPQVVLDFFGGRGSTLMACEKTDRTCLMIEFDEGRCCEIIANWQTITKRKAIVL